MYAGYLILLFKDERARCISLYTMRNKVVQHSIVRELGMIYENALSESCYSYRSGKYVLQAAQHIRDKITSLEKGYVLRTDAGRKEESDRKFEKKKVTLFDSIYLSKMFEMSRKENSPQKSKNRGRV